MLKELKKKEADPAVVFAAAHELMAQQKQSDS